MGTLIYSSHLRINISDRMLAHLQIVIGNKLRRQEPFYLTVPAAADQPRRTIWLSHSLPLAYEYDSEAATPINRVWLEKLSVSANTASGLFPLPEPAPDEGPGTPVTRR